MRKRVAALTLAGLAVASCGKSVAKKREEIKTCSATSLDAPIESPVEQRERRGAAKLPASRALRARKCQASQQCPLRHRQGTFVGANHETMRGSSKYFRCRPGLRLCFGTG